jgi:5-methylcytosine-specific restriction enzyme A
MPSKPPLHRPAVGKIAAEVKRELDGLRPSAAARGYGSRWRQARTGFLRRNPLCDACAKAGLLVPATVVDHVIPHRGNRELFWDQTNWAPSCKRCHDGKTAREGRWGRQTRGEHNVRRSHGCDINGMPLDPEHPWNREARGEVTKS